MSNSYDFGHFSDDSQELKRLMLQAKHALDIEKSIWNTLPIKPGMNVLDLGCGPGLITISMSNHFPSLNITGLDINSQLLEVAHQQEYDENFLQFKEGSVYKLPFRDNQFDFIYSRFLFQHLDSPLDGLKEAFRVLKPKGHICVIDVDDRWLCLEPRCESFEKLKSLAVKHQEEKGGNRYIGQHLANLMHRSYFERIKTDINVITSHDIGINAFLEITTGFKKETIDNPQKGTQLIKHINEFCESHTNVWGAVGVFIVTATKQPSDVQ